MVFTANFSEVKSVIGPVHFGPIGWVIHEKDTYTIKVEPLGYLTGIEHSGCVFKKFLELAL